jgi:transcriptional regulator with XRE-family HTH domain
MQILALLLNVRGLTIRQIAQRSGIVSRSIYRWWIDGLVPQPAKFKKLAMFAKRYGWKE